VLNLDPSKLFVIAVLAIVLLGPEKLPGAARQIGLVWRALTRWRERVEAEVRSTLPDLPSTQDISQMIRSPGTLLNRLASETTSDGVTEARDDATTAAHDLSASQSAASPAPGPVAESAPPSQLADTASARQN
jgi:sec-independent protein translocase protein TatB